MVLNGSGSKLQFDLVIPVLSDLELTSECKGISGFEWSGSWVEKWYNIKVFQVLEW
jgi:hypothetical protein